MLLSSKTSISSEAVKSFLNLDTRPLTSIVVLCHFQICRKQNEGDMCTLPRACPESSPEYFMTNLKHKTQSKHTPSVPSMTRSENFHIWGYTSWQLGRQERKKKFNMPLTLQQKLSPPCEYDTLNEHPSQRPAFGALLVAVFSKLANACCQCENWF